ASHHALAFTFSGHDPGVCAYGTRAIAMLLLGFPRKALQLSDDAVSLARTLAHPYSVAMSMWLSVIVLQVSRQGRSCADVATDLIEFSQEHDFPITLGGGTFFLG